MHPELREWIKRIKDKPIPVLVQTVDQLRKLNARDDAPVHEIVEVVEQDPGLTVQLLRFCNDQQGHRLQREVASVQQAIMLVGTRKLSDMAMKLPLLHKTLQEPARSQVLRVFCRAYHAGMQAIEWAKLRRDMTPDEVFAATQLHFLGEMVLAQHAPNKLLECFEMRREKNIASEEAQYLVLGFTFDQLSMAIAREWHLPQLVIEALQSENANHPRGFTIMLAVQLARSASIDWYSDKMRGIYKQIAECIGYPEDDICKWSHKMAVSVAQHTNYHGVLQAAALLPQIRTSSENQQVKQTFSEDYQADVCLTPQINVLKDTLLKLKTAIQQKRDSDQIVHICLEGIHDGIGLNRVVFATPDNERRALHARAVIGADNDPVFNRFTIKLDKPHLFLRLLDKTQAVCINDETRAKFWPMIPVEFQKLIGTNSFVAMSMFDKDKLIGLLYADRHTSACQIDAASYNLFKNLCKSLEQAISQAA